MFTTRGKGFRQQSTKKVKASLLAKRDKLMREMMETCCIVNIPRIAQGFYFYDIEKDELFNPSPEMAKMLNNNEYKWVFTCCFIGKSHFEQYITAWDVFCHTPVKFPAMREPINLATLHAIDKQCNANHFVAEGWVCKFGEEATDEQLMHIAELLGVYTKEKANWEIKDEISN